MLFLQRTLNTQYFAKAFIILKETGLQCLLNTYNHADLRLMFRLHTNTLIPVAFCFENQIFRP